MGSKFKVQSVLFNMICAAKKCACRNYTIFNRIQTIQIAILIAVVNAVIAAIPQKLPFQAAGS